MHRLLMLALMLILAGCNLGASATMTETPAPTPDIPQVEILSPPNNRQVLEEVVFEIDIVARDSTSGVARIELLVDGEVINEATPPDNPTENVFRVIMNWRARGEGRHIIEAIAYRADDTPSDAATINVEVLPRE